METLLIIDISSSSQSRYQEQLPKLIQARKDKHLLHDELVQVTKWKLMRGKHRPRLVDLVRINTELAVLQTTKKAFKKIPNIQGAIHALVNLKGIGPATASGMIKTKLQTTNFIFFFVHSSRSRSRFP